MGDINVCALRGVNVQIATGEFVALVGPSGCGKSTLMHLLGCLDTPTSGRYWLEGLEVSKLTSAERSRVRSARVGFIFQAFNLMPRLCALGNVSLPLLYQGGARAARKRAAIALERVGLAHRGDHRPGELSGGERQRVAIARALVTEPAVILADEPTGSLDSDTGSGILRLLAELNQEGRTLVVVSHDAGVAGRAGRVLHMLDGQIERSAAGSCESPHKPAVGEPVRDRWDS
jgi:putative ABC transport system ATP-binding protein